ncbi:MAG: asparagine synthase (glutamine-hydrolyzing) [Candidatus Omnitrophica bacterium]|nr:asparagine synthase (glutamine-hydrolyzing) [Candidatus Omnitrophota bacterium]MBU1997328.1 asparagine synthase (glutamine-hydrolyzing) [Candidatus Omnitrophota bacterium]MBU4333823.1 asparagine synthase (glutamine-hydrolyzing) [Candidatus Omnitrophota bacterium]
MCGISGYILKEENSNNSLIVSKLLEPIKHRGPDDEGVGLISRKDSTFKLFKTDSTVGPLAADLPHYSNNDQKFNHDLAFIHTRFSIIDLTSAGHQPFMSQDKSIIAIFNGEIYNYIELRNELKSEGVTFKTSSDTEVLVEGYRIWGKSLWTKMNGFWAIALYDFNTNKVILSRDRIGVAPLYYRITDKGFYFSSTIQALINISPSDIDPNLDSIFGYLQTGIKDQDNSTFYSDINSLPAASTIEFELNSCDYNRSRIIEFWDLPNSRLSTHDISFGQAVKEFRDIFFNAVDIRLRADVKIAFELSGGLDSSSVVAAAAELRNSDITTYTASLKDADEEPFARSILKIYKIDYNVIRDIEDDFVKDFGYFSKVMEEPYDNPNAYTHHKMLQKMKSKGAHVVITGAGGDEVLAGYEASFWPKAYKELKAGGFRSFVFADWYEFKRRFKTLNSSIDMLKHYVSLPKRRINNLFHNDSHPSYKQVDTSASKYQQLYNNLSFHGQSIYHFKTALLPFYMRSSDHFTMGIPIEHRFPLLDHRIVSFGLKMPIQYLFNNGWTKYLLRKAMEPYLPKKIVWRRKKMGFSFPYKIFFQKHKSSFKPLINSLSKIDIMLRDDESYESLLENDPVLLWRYLSVAIWIKYNLGA